jgi:hypothetical protein
MAEKYPKYRTVKIFGDDAPVVIRPHAEGGYECSYNRRHGDTRSDIICTGYGETEADAMRDYLAECHRREADYLYETKKIPPSDPPEE